MTENRADVLVLELDPAVVLGRDRLVRNRSARLGNRGRRAVKRHCEDVLGHLVEHDGELGRSLDRHRIEHLAVGIPLPGHPLFDLARFLDGELRRIADLEISLRYPVGIEAIEVKVARSYESGHGCYPLPTPPKAVVCFSNNYVLVFI